MSGIAHDENVSVVMQSALSRLDKDVRLGSDRSRDVDERALEIRLKIIYPEVLDKVHLQAQKHANK